MDYTAERSADSQRVVGEMFGSGGLFVTERLMPGSILFLLRVSAIAYVLNPSTVLLRYPSTRTVLMRLIVMWFIQQTGGRGCLYL